MKVPSVFIHGLEGSSKGTKARFFQKHFPHIDISDYRGSLENRLAKLEDLTSRMTSVIIVGSSYGGLMGAIYASSHPGKVKKLVLLAPALSYGGFALQVEKRIQVPTTIYHGTEDDVVPLDPVRIIAKQIFPNLTFHAVNDDHVLNSTFHAMDWHSLLKG